MSGNPPPEVAAAARLVEDWLARQKAPAEPAAARPMSAAEKLDHCRQFDQSKMPAWRNPRDAA
jgi:hypothetical protein